ncbi:MAG: SDR family NAD(P)-dependent oxidoreductase [Sediminibacterium sp.]|jgi:3-oxoacyl-[acyl-carrier protein] reductase
MDTVLIVGINGAIGNATARFYREQGFRCIGTTSKVQQRNTESLDLLYLDLNNQDSIVGLAKKMPALSGIIFCAGVKPSTNLADTTLAHHQLMLNMHVSGPLFVVQSLQKKLKKNGAIVFISSIAAQKGSYDPSYAIAKSAVIGMTRTLANELAPKNIRVNAIAPGLVKDTPVDKGMTADFRAKHLKQIILNKLTTAKDCAEAIYYLFSQKQMTGQVVHVNGGQYFGN